MDSITSVIEVAAAAVSNKPRARAKKVAGKVANKGGVRAYETNGKVRFCAQVRAKGKSLSKSFDTREEAEAWKKAQEIGPELAKPTMKLSACFDAFIKLGDESAIQPATWSGIKLQIERLKAHPVLAELRVDQITTKIALDYFNARTADGKSPSTNLSDFVRWRNALRTVASANRASWGTFDPLNDDVRKQLKNAKLIAESTELERIATDEELVALRAYFTELAQKPGASVAQQRMLAIFEIAQINGFRRGEIERMEWSGFDERQLQIRLERKDSKSRGGRRACPVPLLSEALEIIKAQPRAEGEERIFPVKGDTISQLFIDACIALKINTPATPDEDRLTFHGLRHTALTRLAQNMALYGIGLPELKAISGHKSTRHLERYLNFKSGNAHRIALKLQSFRVNGGDVAPLKVAA